MCISGDEKIPPIPAIPPLKNSGGDQELSQKHMARNFPAVDTLLFLFS